MKKEKAIILVSGGLDSLTTLAVAIYEGVEPFILHINYGQVTQAKEEQCFNDIIKYYAISNKLVVDISYLTQIGGSALTDLNMERINQRTKNNIPNSYVPYRNANIISIATSWAEVIGAKAIYIGANEIDYSSYPDCRRIFFDAMEKSIALGTKPDTHIMIRTPLINLSKSDIIKLGNKLNVPFELTWSCYYSEDKACGECDSCILRLKGFQNAGLTDPIIYKAEKDKI